MKKLLHLLRAGLIGGLALIVVGSVIAAGESHRSRTAATDPAAVQGQAAPDSVESAGDSAEDDAALRESRPRAVMMQFGLVGAIVAILTTLVLFLFPVGPVTKTIYGLVVGAAIPVFALGASEIRHGRADNLAGLVLIGMLVGLLAGLLEASRVTAQRRLERTGMDA